MGHPSKLTYKTFKLIRVRFKYKSVIEIVLYIVLFMLTSVSGSFFHSSDTANKGNHMNIGTFTQLCAETTKFLLPVPAVNDITIVLLIGIT